MSSMRNAAPRRPHKERSQPGARSKWGLLEKHKDYSLRAADYNQKKKKLNILSQKSREKNPDEFAFGMLSSDSQKAGKHGRGDGDKNRLSVDEVKLLKGQDAGYLRTVLGRTRREVEKVKEEINMDTVLKRRGVSSAVGGENEKKILFDSDGQPIPKKRKISIEIDSESEDDDAVEEIEIEAINHNSNPDPNTDIDIDTNTTPPPPPSRSSKSQLQKQALLQTQQKAQSRLRKRLRLARAAKLDALKARQKSIMAAATELELQRARMARTIGGTNKNGVRFRVRERKK